MGQSRSRLEKEKFLIAGNRSWLRAGIDFIFTLIFWVYSLTVVAFMLSATFGFNNDLTRVLNASFNTINQDIRNLVMLAFTIFLFFYVVLHLNRIYNKKKFGSMTRRSYPLSVTDADLLALGIVDNEMLQRLQQEDYSVYETNPIIALEGEKQ